ncbi:MAG TPA: YggT family protein [Micromonosporaceae bacterium]|nr:YggT family protein [Micromonosporaceae bacterium]
MVSILGQILFLACYLALLLLIARLVMSLVMQYGRRWRPGRAAAASLEVVWSVTDPPLHALRRVIPPLRIGTVSLDIAFWVLFLILYLLMTVVASQLI